MPIRSKNALVAWIAWWLLRRRLRRSDSLFAAAGVLGLELLGPRLILFRRLILFVAVGTVVGLVLVVVVWIALRRRGAGGDGGSDEPEPEPAPEPAPPAVEADPPPVPVGA